jgi:hypothetical protein
MGWIADLFRRGPRPCIRLDPRKAWEVSPPVDAAAFVRGLGMVAPVGAVVYLEATGTAARAREVLESMECEPQVRVATGTLWPRPRCFHIPMTPPNLGTVAALFEEHASPEICDHFHVYADRDVLLEWHDAFWSDPLLLSGRIPEESVEGFCRRIGSSYQRWRGG